LQPRCPRARLRRLVDLQTRQPCLEHSAGA
jgi:hypothetical protein